jgi:hypothetical protein
MQGTADSPIRRDDSVYVRQWLGQIAGSALLFLLFELIDQINRIVETHPLALVDSGNAQGRCQMSFTGPGALIKIRLYA